LRGWLARSSGGEQAPLAFSKLILTKPNILIRDEPMNHLDLEAINALNIALRRYEGTVLLVTHDHNLIDEVASRLWIFHDGGIEDFQGPYEEWKGKAQLRQTMRSGPPVRFLELLRRSYGLLAHQSFTRGILLHKIIRARV